jgi:hypothetical protein
MPLHWRLWRSPPWLRNSIGECEKVEPADWRNLQQLYLGTIAGGNPNSIDALLPLGHVVFRTLGNSFAAYAARSRVPRGRNKRDAEASMCR